MASRFAFGPFELDAEKGVLWRQGEVVALTPKAVRLLQVLVEHEGDLVTRQELMARVWADTVVEEANLTVTVGMLRRALGRQPGGRTYVETVPRRGYRFSAPVTGGGSTAPLSLAVLPFRSLGPAEPHLGLALADALIERLTANPDLVVRPTGSVVAYAEVARPPLEAARELGVDAVVEGSVLKDAGRIRVTLHLVPRSRRVKPWAESIDAPATEMFELQDTLAERMLKALEPQLLASSSPPRASPRHPEAAAHEAYLRGRYFWVRLQPRDVGEALGCFAEAVQLDPAFGPPHAGLADAYLLFSFGGIIAPGEAWALAGECAERALALDPEAAEACVSLAWTTVFRDWDWPEARRLFDRALALKPTAAFPHLWLGLLRLAQGDGPGARGSLAHARERDPLSALLFLVLALERIVANDHETALSLGRDAVRLRPEHFVSHWVLAMALSASGRAAQARTAQRRALGLSDGGPVMKAVMASMLARAGDEGGARALLDELDRATGFPSAYARGAVLVALGDRERGLDRLSEAADQREPWVPFMGIDPAWDTVRGAPRYVRLKERVFARS